MLSQHGDGVEVQVTYCGSFASVINQDGRQLLV